MAKQKKKSGGRSGSWKKERASVNSGNKSRPMSNKYRAGSDKGKRPEDATRYWRAGYTRKDGTKVKGHYVTKPS